MNHGNAVRSGSRGRLGPPDGINDIIFNERGIVSDHLFLPDSTQNSPRNREVLVRSYGGELPVELFGDRRPFCVYFVVEGNGLIGWPIGTLSRETSDQVGKLRRVRLVLGIGQLFIERFMFSLVTGLTNLAL